MTKIRGPLLSLIASGRFAGNVVFRNTPHGPVATRFHFPGSANTVTPSAAQLANRANYGSLVASWRAFTQPQRDQWNADALPFAISGWNLYLRMNFDKGIEQVGVVGTTSELEGSGPTLTYTRPAGAGDGHLVLIGGNWDEASSFALPSGFAHVPGSPQFNADQGTFLAYLVLGPSPPATWVMSGNDFDRCGAIVAYSGVDTTTPVEAGAGQTNSSSANVTAPTITTLSADALLIGVYGTDAGSPATITFTPPATMDELADINPGANTWAAMMMAKELFPTPGATGTRVAVASSAEDNAGILCALKAA